MSISVIGAGAFGTALAIALSRDGAEVTLWGRDADDVKQMQEGRKSGRKLPGHALPDSLSVTSRSECVSKRHPSFVDSIASLGRICDHA